MRPIYPIRSLHVHSRCSPARKFFVRFANRAFPRRPARRRATRKRAGIPARTSPRAAAPAGIRRLRALPGNASVGGDVRAGTPAHPSRAGARLALAPASFRNTQPRRRQGPGARASPPARCRKTRCSRGGTVSRLGRRRSGRCRRAVWKAGLAAGGICVYFLCGRDRARRFAD